MVMNCLLWRSGTWIQQGNNRLLFQVICLGALCPDSLLLWDTQLYNLVRFCYCRAQSAIPPSFFQTWGLFLESPNNFSGPKSCFMFAVFAFKIKVSIILKMIQWKYQLKKQNWPVCGLGTLLLFNWFWFENLPSDPKSCQAFRETGPWSILYDWFTYTVSFTDYFWFAWLLYCSFENEKKTCKMLMCLPLELQL